MRADDTSSPGRTDLEPAGDESPDDLDGPKLLVGTRKGAWILAADSARRRWAIRPPMFLGHIIQHLVLRSSRRPDVADGVQDRAPRPDGVPVDRPRADVDRRRAGRPTFRPGDAHGRSVRSVFWLSPGPTGEPGTWYAGASPQGLFRTDRRRRHLDAGRRLERSSAAGPTWAEWPDVEGTPDGSMLHSIIVDPRDAAHLYLALSGGGVFESTDGGADWHPLNAGCAADFLPDPDVPTGHDPHCVRLHPLQPDRLYQQNHCGIYRLDRPGRPLGAHRRQHARATSATSASRSSCTHADPDTAWVFPMDGTDVWPRTSPDGRPAAYVTRDGGQSWRRLRPGSSRARLVHGQAPGDVRRRQRPGRGVLRHDRAARSGGAPTRASTGRASQPTSPRSTPWRSREGRAHPDATALVHGGTPAPWCGEGTPLAEVLDDLDRQFPGLAFRVVDEQARLRPHMVIWLGQDRCRDLTTPLDGIDEVVIMQALSGG